MQLSKGIFLTPFLLLLFTCPSVEATDKKDGHIATTYPPAEATDKKDGHIAMKLILVSFCLFALGAVMYHCYLKREKKQKFDTKYYGQYNVGDNLILASGKVMSDCYKCEDGDDKKHHDDKKDHHDDDNNDGPLPAWMTQIEKNDEE